MAARASAAARATNPPARAGRPSRAPAPSRRAELRVLPGRRRMAGLAVGIGVLVFGLLFSVTAFQTRLAQRQLQLDQVQRAVDDAATRYEELRAQRAALRSPERLAAEATRLGLMPGTNTEFLAVSQDVVSEVAASSGGIDPDVATGSPDPLDDFSQVKSAVGAAP